MPLPAQVCSPSGEDEIESPLGFQWYKERSYLFMHAMFWFTLFQENDMFGATQGIHLKPFKKTKIFKVQKKKGYPFKVSLIWTKLEKQTFKISTTNNFYVRTCICISMHYVIYDIFYLCIVLFWNDLAKKYLLRFVCVTWRKIIDLLFNK